VTASDRAVEAFGPFRAAPWVTRIAHIALCFHTSIRQERSNPE
jgi:hypothetical protein